MRVYEFAKKVGATCAAVMKMAEEKGVEVYSPLSQLEPEDVETLNKQLLAVGPAAVKEEAAAAGERARAKAARAAAARAVHDKAQAEALEAARQRAIAAHEGRALSLPVPPPAVSAAPKPVAAPKAEERKVEIGVSLPELPKVSIQMGESEDEGASEASDFEDDEVDARDYLHGKDLERRDAKSASAKKDQAAKKETAKKEQASARKEAAAKKPAAPAPAPVKKPVVAPPPKPVPPPAPRVGGLRAGFSSVSMRVSRPQVQIVPGRPVISTGTAAPAPVVPP